MDPQTSFKIPILIRRRLQNRSLSPRIYSRLNSSLAFKDIEQTQKNQKNIHELSPRLGMRLNPGYRMEYTLAKTEMKNQYPNYYKLKAHQKSVVTDKLFFKKKDELVNYAESFFKNKILYSKK